MHEHTTRRGAPFPGVPTGEPLNGVDLTAQADRPPEPRPATWIQTQTGPPPGTRAPRQPEVLPTPLLDRLDPRPLTMLAFGALAGALVVVVAMVLFRAAGDSSTAVESSELFGSDAALASTADGGDGTDRVGGLPVDDPTTMPSTSMASTSTTLTVTTATTAVISTTVPTTAAPPTEPPTTPSTTSPTTATTAPPSTTVTTEAPSADTAPPTSDTVATTGPSSTATPPVASGNDATIQQAVLDATNAERAAAGCPPLKLDPLLNAAADGHSEDMAARNYFDHRDPEDRGPGFRIDAVGYPHRGWGENIAAGQGSAQEVVADWMGSSGHRANILNCSFDELGVGYAEGQGSGRVPGRYWTQLFGTRR